MNVYVIGDEIYAADELVAILVQSPYDHSKMGEFVDGLEAGTLFEGELECLECDGSMQVAHSRKCSKYEPKHCFPSNGSHESDSAYDRALDDLVRSLKHKGGLVKMADIESIVSQLKEDEENDQ